MPTLHRKGQIIVNSCLTVISTKIRSTEGILDIPKIHRGEDWAENWAHYFQVVDSLHTALL